mgnify:CR=1 FL=1
MKSLSFTVFMALFFVLTAFGQAEFTMKIENGFLFFNKTLVDIDPGPDWQGHYLNKEQNAFDVTIGGDLEVFERFSAGIGLGYMNFEGTNGLSLASDLTYVILPSKISPLVHGRLGYHHLWNQYDDGTGTFLAEINLGLQYLLTKQTAIYMKSGFFIAQEALLIPFRIGVRF